MTAQDRARRASAGGGRLLSGADFGYLAATTLAALFIALALPALGLPVRGAAFAGIRWWFNATCLLVMALYFAGILLRVRRLAGGATKAAAWMVWIIGTLATAWSAAVFFELVPPLLL